ncbi:hypothetical protein ACMFMG_010389 [Clarireedia jacksonii]
MILEPVVVKPWIQAGDDFVLEEDRDSGYGWNKNGTENKFKKWKRENGLEVYKNCRHSPDLAPIENAWQPLKSYLRSQPYWDDETMKGLIQEAWDGIKEEVINK